MLEEIELPYKIIPVDVWKGDNYLPEFRKINPNGKIPVIVDHEGPGGRPFTVIESGAILMYLADKTGRFLPKETAARYEVIQWLMIQLTGVGPMFGQLTHFKLFAPPGNDYSLSRYQTEVRRLYDVLEARLATTAYLGGADYSIADMATYPVGRQPSAPGGELRGQAQSQALARRHRGAPRRAARHPQGRSHADQPRPCQARRCRSLFRPRALCQTVIAAQRDALSRRGEDIMQASIRALMLIACCARRGAAAASPIARGFLQGQADSRGGGHRGRAGLRHLGAAGRPPYAEICSGQSRPSSSRTCRAPAR